MGRFAKNVVTDPADIARIEALAGTLQSGSRVRVRSRDGEIVTGMVAELPIVQLFEDADGNEGMNAVLRLEDPDVPTFDAYLWLDQIESVAPIDTGREH